MIPLLAALALSSAPQDVGPVSEPSPAGQVPTTQAALLPDTVVTAPGGPRIVVLGAPVGGVAALRLFVPFREGAAEAGVGTILRDLATQRIEALARPVGARVSAARTPWGLAYTVEGAVADFEYLAYLLREAVARPDVSGVALTEARLRMIDEVARALETPSGRLEADLRRSVAPAHPPAGGTPATAPTMDAARVLSAWRRSHHAEAMTLVVSAGVVPEVILAATRTMGAPPDDAASPPDAPAPAGPGRIRPQALRSWFGQAWSAGPSRTPAAPVAALLVAQNLARRTDGFEAELQLWELPEGWVLAALGAAYAPAAGRMRTSVARAVTSTLEDLSEPEVRAAVARVRQDVLFRARSPAGLVGLVGRAMEATGDPAAASEYAAALDALDDAAVRDFLARLAASGPYTAEVRP